MLSAVDMEKMRATVDSALPDTCLVLDTVPTSDGAGGQTYGADPTPTSYPCRIAPRLATGTGQLKDAEMDQAGRMVTQAPWLITMPAGAELHTTSVIVDEDARGFEVFAVLAPRSDELATLVLCRLINEGDG